MSTSSRVCFNSCMVQLKFSQAEAPHLEIPGFNSCMVQLKLHLHRLPADRLGVLIPVWCN